MAADMGYMHRPVELLSDPKKLQKSARSVVSLGVSYYPGDHPENEGGGRVARYAWGLDYHEVIKGRLFRLREELEEELGVRIRARGFTDAVPLLERSAAQHAGLGFFGRNSCLINNEIGSYFFIADLIVDLDPFVFQGEVEGFLTRLSGTSLANVTPGGGQVPAFLVEPV